MWFDFSGHEALHGVIAEAVISSEVATFASVHFGHASLAYGQLTNLLTPEDWLVAERWQLEALLERQLVRALLETDCANGASPHFVILEFTMQIQQLAMVLEVVDLLLDVDGGGLLVDVEGKFDVLVLEALLPLEPHIALNLGLLLAHSLRIFKRLLDALISLF